MNLNKGVLQYTVLKNKKCLFGPCGGGGRRNWKSKVSKNARFREEENEPIGEAIGREMAKRMRDKQTNKQKERQTLDAFINRYMIFRAKE